MLAVGLYFTCISVSFLFVERSVSLLLYVITVFLTSSLMVLIVLYFIIREWTCEVPKARCTPPEVRSLRRRGSGRWVLSANPLYSSLRIGLGASRPLPPVPVNPYSELEDPYDHVYTSIAPTETQV